jgi:hypothetical protein
MTGEPTINQRKDSAMNFVTTIQRALTGEITVKTWWGCNGLTGDGFRQWFQERLDARINREDRRRWRRLSSEYQASLMRDAIRVRQITRQRVIHRQFETDIFASRFSHLLTKDRA